MTRSGLDATVGRRGTEAEILKGNLQEISLSSLLQALNADGRSGWLHLEGGGEIVLVNGEVVAASTSNAEGNAAIQALLARRSGDFSFTRGDPPRGEPIASMMGLILESARLDDEWQRLAPNVVEVRDRSKINPKDPCISTLLPWIDGRRSVAQLAHLGVSTTAQIIESINAALASGALGRVRGRRAPEPLVDEDFDELIDGARVHMRAGELEAAAAAFHRALALRPDDRIARQNLRRVAALISTRDKRNERQGE